MKYRDLYTKDAITEQETKKEKRFFNSEKELYYTVNSMDERKYNNKDGKEIIAFSIWLENEEGKKQDMFIPAFYYNKEGVATGTRDFKLILNAFVKEEAAKAVKNGDDVIEVFKTLIPEKVLGHKIKIKFFPPENNFQNIAFIYDQGIDENISL